MKWRLFRSAIIHQLLKVVGENRLEWQAKVRIEHFRETKRLKKLFE